MASTTPSLALATTRFKPYYKWIIFNILSKDTLLGNISNVLNLIING